MDGASFLCKVAGEFYEVKLADKNCMEAFFPAFQGSAIAPLPYGNGCAALPIGRRLYGKYPKNNAINIANCHAELVSASLCVIVILDSESSSE